MAYISETVGPYRVTGSYADFMGADASFLHFVRCFSLVNTSALARTFDVSIGAGANARLIFTGTIPAHETRVFKGRWQIPLNTAIQARTGTNDTCTLTASGYKIT